MSQSKITRREAGQILLSAAAASYLAGSALGAQPFDKDKKKKPPASPPGQNQPSNPSPKAPPQIDFTKLLTQDHKRDWTLRGEINVAAYVQPPRDIKKELPQVQEFNFDSVVVVFPLIKGCASHRVYDAELKSKLTWNEHVALEQPSDMKEDYPAGTRLGRWNLAAPQGTKLTGRTMKLEVEISQSCWRTKFDEKLAELVPWPKGNWGPVAASTFRDPQMITGQRFGMTNMGQIALIDHQSEIAQGLVRKWCGNKDPKSISPVELAKFLAGNVLELIQPSGNGLNFADNGMLEGMDLQGSTATLETRKGTEQDITCALCAIYRAAGLPARIVIGFDVTDDKADKDSFLKRQRDVANFRSWVEFCLFDERTRKEYWIPVDVNRQRKKSNRILSNPNGWRYFGDNDDLDLVCPFAFQFHPPTTVIAHGSVAFWGWLAFPQAPQATQYLRFDARTTAKTKDTEKNRQHEEEKSNQPPPIKP